MNKEDEKALGTLAGLTFVLSPEEYTKYKKSLNEQLEEKDKEIERLNNIISSFEKRIITIKNKCEQILTEAPLDVRINERDKINLLDSVLKYLEEMKEGK